MLSAAKADNITDKNNRAVSEQIFFIGQYLTKSIFVRVVSKPDILLNLRRYNNTI
jgi:hypothetical protein